jgi:hypothetical protein
MRPLSQNNNGGRTASKIKGFASAAFLGDSKERCDGVANARQLMLARRDTCSHVRPT